MNKLNLPVVLIIGFVVIGGSIITTQVLKQNSIERQKQAEISWEKEQALTKEKAEADRKFQLDFCLRQAEIAYWDYIELNGTAVKGKEGVYNAPQYTWNEAQKRKDNKEKTCFEKYK